MNIFSFNWATLISALPILEMPLSFILKPLVLITKMPAFFYSNKQQYIEMVKVPGRDLQIDQDLYLEFTLKKLIQSLDVVYGQCSLFSLTVSSPNTRPVSLNFSYLSVTNKNSLTAQKIERDREIRLIFDKNGIFSGLINRNGESIQEESVLLDQLSVLCDEEKKLFKLCSVALNLKPAAIDEHSVDKYRLIFKKNNFH